MPVQLENEPGEKSHHGSGEKHPQRGQQQPFFEQRLNAFPFCINAAREEDNREGYRTNPLSDQWIVKVNSAQSL